VSRHRRRSILGLGFVLFSIPASVRAEAPDVSADSEFSKLVNQGLDQYQATRFEDAITSFKAALAIKPDPKLLYNIARSYEKLGKIDESIDHYQKFVDAPGSTAQDRAKALEQIKALRAEKSAREAVRAEREPAASLNAGGGEPGTGRAMEGSVRSTAPVRTERPRRQGGSHAIDYALIGVGAAGIGAGVVFGVLALGEKSSYDSAITVADKNAHRDAGSRDALISDVAVVGGVALAALGVVLLLASDGDDDAVAVAPSVSNQGVYGSMRVRF
jgi:tetratricopeptide (TPR) repeat protein